MYKIEFKKEWPMLVVLLLTLISPLFLYQHLPEQLPVHWNMMGDVDKYLAKSWLTAFYLPLVIAGCYLLMLFIPYLDPKKKNYSKFLGSYRIMRHAIILVLVGVYGAVIAFSLGYPIAINKVVVGIVSLLFIIIGNYLGKIRSNWFVGIKLPWTLANEDVWNKTHRLAGKLWVGSGIIGLIGVLLPTFWTTALLLVPILLSVIITVIYSAELYFKQNHQ